MSEITYTCKCGFKGIIHLKGDGTIECPQCHKIIKRKYIGRGQYEFKEEKMNQTSEARDCIHWLRCSKNNTKEVNCDECDSYESVYPQNPLEDDKRRK